MNGENKVWRSPEFTPKRKAGQWLTIGSAVLAVTAAATIPAAVSTRHDTAQSATTTSATTTSALAVRAAAASTNGCSRRCMSSIVDEVLKSMVKHDPYDLPLATVYKATENSHAAALGMMTLWSTVTEAGEPDLLAIDTTNGQAYLAMNVKESGSEAVLWGRIKVVDKKITELELYINRSRGDHGFTYADAEDLAENYQELMSPPAARVKATRAELLALGQANFDPTSTVQVTISSTCQFTEVGGDVIDPGLDGNMGDDPLGCVFPADRPADPNARDNLVIDEELGIVVVGGMVPGKVYPYPWYGETISAFIPDDMTAAQAAQQQWYEQEAAEGTSTLMAPTAATGVTLAVFQYYDNELQASQINVNLAGPGMESTWVE